MMWPFSRSWFFLRSTVGVLLALCDVSGQSSECNALASVFPRCSCRRSFDYYCVTSRISVDCTSRGLSLVPNSGTQFSIDELKLNHNNIVSLGDSILRNLNITKLSFRGNDIGSVHDHAFKNISSHLKVLYLSGNRSSQLPIQAFHYLGQVENLTLANYNMSMMEHLGGYFLPLTQLKHLTLDNWNLMVIEPGSFLLVNSRRLQSLKLLNQAFVVLPLDELQSSDLRDLQTLRISHTNITEITLDSFSNQNRLTKLNLNRNKITALDANCFRGVNATLAKLSLSHNRLPSLLPGLADLTNLEVLDLSFNRVEQFPNLSMLHTTKPLMLNLSHNRITAVPENALVGLEEKLQTLDLSYNRIVSFQLDVSRFRVLDNLILAHQSYSGSSSNII